MSSEPLIQEAVKRLVDAAHPLKVILFGSHAAGTANVNSDLDFLVIESTVKNKLKEMVRLRRTLHGLGVPIDVLVASKQDIDDWGHLPSTALYWAVKEGKVLHDASH